jgi:TonB family protein
MTATRNLEMAGVESREHKLRRREVPGTVRFYLTTNRAYIVEAMGADQSHPDVNRFFSSFELGKHSSGILVKDGPGFQSQPKEAPAPSPPNGDDTGKTGGPGQTASVPGVVSRLAELSRRALVVTRPNPVYTEEARKNAVVGKVVIKVVLSASGRLTNIKVLSDLPNGLTESALAATNQIRFVPAMKDGRFVSTYAQFEYTFTVY